MTSALKGLRWGHWGCWDVFLLSYTLMGNQENRRGSHKPSEKMLRNCKCLLQNTPLWFSISVCLESAVHILFSSHNMNIPLEKKNQTQDIKTCSVRIILQLWFGVNAPKTHLKMECVHKLRGFKLHCCVADGVVTCHPCMLWQDSPALLMQVYWRVTEEKQNECMQKGKQAEVCTCIKTAGGHFLTWIRVKNL